MFHSTRGRTHPGLFVTAEVGHLPPVLALRACPHHLVGQPVDLVLGGDDVAKVVLVGRRKGPSQGGGGGAVGDGGRRGTSRGAGYQHAPPHVLQGMLLLLERRQLVLPNTVGRSLCRG